MIFSIHFLGGIMDGHVGFASSRIAPSHMKGVEYHYSVYWTAKLKKTTFVPLGFKGSFDSVKV